MVVQDEMGPNNGTPEMVSEMVSGTIFDSGWARNEASTGPRSNCPWHLFGFATVRPVGRPPGRSNCP